MSFGPGTVFKHYRIERLIGKGGMGEVYLAEETTLGRKVAIKVLKQEATADPKFVERFRNEARMLGQLNHPNIVGLHTFFEDGGTYYLVMQYAPGITLAELIRRTGPIPEQRAMRIFAQLAEAITFAHGEGIVHRDIKPSNIMVDPDRNDRVLVMDFGIARMMDSQHITRTGAQVGTPCYMSPEQVLGKKDIGPASDVYSSGVLLYEMLAGSLPYDLEADSLYTIQDRILKEPMPDPRLRYEYISERAVELIKNFTLKEPQKRSRCIVDGLIEWAEGQETLTHNLMDNIQEKKTQVSYSRQTGNSINKMISSDSNNILSPKRKRGKIAMFIVPVTIVVLTLLLIPQLRHSITFFSDALVGSLDMIYVDGGSFMMGSNEGESDEKPVHQVTVSSFIIGKYEVTQKEWRKVMGNNPSYFEGDVLPVGQISWNDAVEYCNKRSIMEGLTPCYSGSGDSIRCDWSANGYRLPTEAEWEYAARSGMVRKGSIYSGSTSILNVAWYEDNSDGNTHAVYTKKPNEIGIYNMSGNVWEWCWDWYGSYPDSRNTDPKGAVSGLYRVLRGGGYDDSKYNCRVANRGSNDPNYWERNTGLRLVRAIK